MNSLGLFSGDGNYNILAQVKYEIRDKINSVSLFLGDGHYDITAEITGECVRAGSSTTN